MLIGLGLTGKAASNDPCFSGKRAKYPYSGFGVFFLACYLVSQLQLVKMLNCRGLGLVSIKAKMKHWFSKLETVPNVHLQLSTLRPSRNASTRFDKINIRFETHFLQFHYQKFLPLKVENLNFQTGLLQTHKQTISITNNRNYYYLTNVTVWAWFSGSVVSPRLWLRKSLYRLFLMRFFFKNGAKFCHMCLTVMLV